MRALHFAIHPAVVRFVTALAGLAVFLGAGAPPAFAQYELEISKSRRELLVRDGDRVARRYAVALGRGGRGDKKTVGDNKTPIGRYRIIKFNAESHFDYFMLLNYPNVKDAFYGLKDKTIDTGDFERIVAALRAGATPPQNTRLGGAIGIHGIGPLNREKLRLHRKLDWTEGCIALTNDEIQELRQYVDVGTLVVISE